MKIIVDRNICQGHARCQDICPDVFATDDLEGKCVLLQNQVPEKHQELARLAVLNCPEGALTINQED